MNIAIRRAALLTFVAGLVGLIIPIWNVTQRFAALESTNARWWIIAGAVTVAFVTPIQPMFYFALYRDKGTLLFSRYLRLLALMAALSLSLSVAVDLARLGSFGQAGTSSVLAPQREAWTLSEWSGVFALLSNAAYIFLMVVVYRQKHDEAITFTPVSKLLRVMTKAAVVVWGVWAAFSLVRLLLTPYTYAALREVALPMGRTPPPLGDLVAQTARTFLSALGLLAGPYIIWRGSRQPNGGAAPSSRRQ